MISPGGPRDCPRWYVEYTDSEALQQIVDTIKQTNTYIYDLEISKKSVARGKKLSVIFSLQIPRKVSQQMIMTTIAETEGVTAVEEL